MSREDVEFELGKVGISKFSTQFIEAEINEVFQGGWEVVLSFETWGNSNDEAMNNFYRLTNNIWAVLQDLSEIYEQNFGKLKLKIEGF